MSDPPSTMKKREKLQSKGLQGENAYNQDTVGMDTELSKGAESERERSTKIPGTGEPERQDPYGYHERISSASSKNVSPNTPKGENV